MKKVFMLALACAGFITTTVKAQQGLSLSVKAIPQFSFLYNKDDYNNSAHTYKATFNAGFGIGAAYNFTNKLGLGADVLYSLQGQRYELNGTEFNQKNDYVKVPVYFSYNSNPSKPISFIGKIGPQVSFITSSKLDDNDGNKIIGDTKNRYENTTFGGMASAGVQYKLQNNLYLTTAFKYDCDFTNAEDDSYINYVSGRAKTYNMTAGFEVGLKYILK